MNMFNSLPVPRAIPACEIVSCPMRAKHRNHRRCTRQNTYHEPRGVNGICDRSTSTCWSFDTLMAERNVTRAAARNGLSQPAVSKALNRLRWLFDDPLFVLRDRATEPTARAHQLAGPIRGALADISHTLTLPDEFDPATIRATVKIVTNDLHHTSLLPSLIQRLRRHDLQVRANDARACMNNSPPACRATKR